ncbi:SusC/RagA family TonB-linked outer membrane protein [Mucilaginibacter hurinus]|uniref:SusC/RagA family TonB-linked outer membrane protein n=1 Tax=Mucilaginibacter hurinus TaxID=2201324 RepID=A0A367GPB3_9SPHI|nr:SusC/RagA family TonB-linked outer membrane protein [Mucilaginibacter hurinus]RCH55332.1 SusC/RagA family TonB-linked outer membrane protein [Mucilaginibacter hurinus]
MFYCYLKRTIIITVVIAGLLQPSYAATAINSKVKKQSAPADTIKGRVIDDFGRQLEGVKIAVVEDTATTAVTDIDGAFQLITAQGNNLVLAHPEFNIQRLKIKSKNLTVRLLKTYIKDPDTIDVLYSRIKAENNLGSIASIYTNQIVTTPATIFPYALAGRLPGLSATQTSGYRNLNQTDALSATLAGFIPTTTGNSESGDNSEITLSLRGQTPITVIDGVQREFSSLEFENIESISVLKDALSTILLGQRSSNGILLVTTKKPVAGPPRISFTAQTAMQQPLKLPKPLPAYQYAYLYNEALQNMGNAPVYTDADFEAYRNGTDPFGYPDVNWFSTLLRKSSPMRKYNLSVDGGSSKARYVVALGYLNQQGMFKDYEIESYNTNTEFSRYTINTNVDVDLSKKFNVSLQLFGRLQNGNQPGATTNTLLSGMYTTPNNAYPIRNANGSFGGSNDFKTNLFSQLTQSGYRIDNTRDVMVNLDLTYKFDDFVKGLWVKAKGNLTTSESSITDRSKVSSVFERVISTSGDTVYNRYGNPSDQVNSFALVSSSQFWYVQGSAGIDRKFGLNNFSFFVMADQRRATINFDLPGTYTNIAGKASYNYNNKYFAEGALNYSGFDRYEPGKRFGLFYAAGLGWKISEESFIKDNASWIDLLKLRATYGRTGNANIGYYTYRTSYEDGNDYQFGADDPPATADGMKEKAQLTTVGATWEKANKLNVGVDFNIFDNKLQFRLDYYRDKYFDLMQPRGTSTSIIGATYPNENIGINLYNGGEFTVTYQNHYNDFNYFITANASIEQSKVIYADEIPRVNDYNRRTGQPVGRGFGYATNGIIQTEEEAASSATFEGYILKPGDLKFVDQNNDGVINDYDQIAVGTGKPRIYYGATLGFSYKGFDFSVLLQGVHNRIISPYYGLDAMRQGNILLLNRWTPSNPLGATLPRLTIGSNVNNTPSFGLNRTFYEQSGNYLRIKNVDLGYNLPYKWISHLGISGMRVFVNGLNLLTFSKNSDIDPEVFGNVYPIQRVINTGVNIKF